MQQLLERLGAVAHGVLLGRIDFGKGLFHAVGDEDGVIAKAVIATRREGEMAMHLAFKGLQFPARQRDT